MKRVMQIEQLRLDGDEIDLQFGFERYKPGASSRLALNYLAISMPDDTGSQKSGLDLYFIDREEILRLRFSVSVLLLGRAK